EVRELRGILYVERRKGVRRHHRVVFFKNHPWVGRRQSNTRIVQTLEPDEARLRIQGEKEPSAQVGKTRHSSWKIDDVGLAISELPEPREIHQRRLRRCRLRLHLNHLLLLRTRMNG